IFSCMAACKITSLLSNQSFKDQFASALPISISSCLRLVMTAFVRSAVKFSVKAVRPSSASFPQSAFACLLSVNEPNLQIRPPTEEMHLKFSHHYFAGGIEPQLFGSPFTFDDWYPGCLRFPAPSDQNQRGGEPSPTRCLLDGKRWIPDNLPELALSQSKHSHAPCLSRKRDPRRRKCVDHAVQPSRSRRSWQNFPTKHGSRPSRLRSHQ